MTIGRSVIRLNIDVKTDEANVRTADFTEQNGLDGIRPRVHGRNVIISCRKKADGLQNRTMNDIKNVGIEWYSLPKLIEHETKRVFTWLSFSSAD